MANSKFQTDDLEQHRQPLLYHLSAEEPGVADPHLICDWIGVATDVNEFDIDLLTLAKQNPCDQVNGDRFLNAKCGQERRNNLPNAPPNKQLKIYHIDSFVDFPNPIREMIEDMKKKTFNVNGKSSSLSQNDVIEDCSDLDFLSVPPISSGLLKRAARNLQLSMARRLKRIPLETVLTTSIQRRMNSESYISPAYHPEIKFRESFTAISKIHLAAPIAIDLSTYEVSVALPAKGSIFTEAEISLKLIWTPKH